MKKVAGMFLIFAAMSAVAFANQGPPVTPEIDPSSAASALALLSGVALMIRGRKK